MRITTKRAAALLLGAGLVIGAASMGSNGPAATASGRCPQFWVAPDGSDAGRGSAQDPWRTVEHARDHLRGSGLTQHQRCDLVINLKAGEYPVKKTITFDDRDSAAEGHRIVYRSVDGPGKARLTGAEDVTGWKPFRDGIYSAPVDLDQPFHTLYVDGQRATAARFPNQKSSETLNPYLRSVLIEPEKEAIHDQIGFNHGDWDESWDLGSGTSWPAQVVVWSGGSWSWFTDTVPIKNPDWQDNKVTLDYWARFSMINSGGGSRYFVQNSLDLLDAPGEYYLDYEARRLYYKPIDGTIDDHRIQYPTVTQLVQLSGASPDRRVHGLTFDGIDFENTDFTDWYRYGWNSAGDSGEVHKYPEYDTQIEMPRNRFGAITVTNARDIVFRRIRVRDTGFTGLYLLFANDHITVADSLFSNLGNDAIKIEGGYPGEGDVAHGNTITNTAIDRVGELVPGDAAGIEIMNSGHNEIDHVQVERGARYGISIESRPEVLDNKDNYADHNTVHHVRLAHLGQDSGDTGAFYAYGILNSAPYDPTSTVSQMIIDDVNADPSMPDQPPYGVHMDFGGCGFAFSDIEVNNTASDPYHGPSAVVCDTFDNVSWEPGFDKTKLDPDIGVTADFPYPIAR